MLRTEKKKKEPIANDNKDNHKNLYDLFIACRVNAIDLLKEAENLYKHECYARAFALAYTANEEIGKGQIVADYINEIVSSDEFKSAFCNHDIKVAYLNPQIFIGELFDSGKTEKHDGQEMPIIHQDNTLRYYIDKRLLKIRNQSLYVDINNDHSPIKPKENYKLDDAKKIIKEVKERLNSILWAEEFNGRIGTKALIK